MSGGGGGGSDGGGSSGVGSSTAAAAVSEAKQYEPCTTWLGLHRCVKSCYQSAPIKTMINPIKDHIQFSLHSEM